MLETNQQPKLVKRKLTAFCYIFDNKLEWTLNHPQKDMELYYIRVPGEDKEIEIEVPDIGRFN